MAGKRAKIEVAAASPAAKRAKVAKGTIVSDPTQAGRGIIATSSPATAKSLQSGIRLGLHKENCAILPVVGFGTYKLKKGEAKTPILEALKAGYRLVDTAQVYENEGDVGQALRESGIPREEIFIETKHWRSSHGYERTMKAFNQSLRRLGTTYMDLYLIHWPGCKTGWPLKTGTTAPPDWAPSMRDDGTWRAMEDLYTEGKVRAIGVANYSVRHLKTLMKSCRIKPMVNQVEFHPLLVQTDLLSYCKDNNIVLQAYASLGSGDAQQTQAFFALAPVAKAAAKHHATPAQVLLRWAIEKGAHVIPKSQKAERMKENADVFKFKLTSTEVKEIDSLHQNKRFSWKGMDPDSIE